MCSIGDTSLLFIDTTQLLPHYFLSSWGIT
nr:MAG TPA: hypothetical protein [Crassvirales sp.]DAG91908.1 MAG TPA: hypothetical protein [Crassvirales sp.]DAH00007.1 MAG TPA: hypothetical protein [Crassvirales sp.]DAI06205.1 MAG TPA: hypothetical protein [Crassvirales sp.]